MAVTNRFGTTAKERKDYPWDKCEWAIVDEVARRTTVQLKWEPGEEGVGPPSQALFIAEDAKVSKESRMRAWEMNRAACLYAIRRHRRRLPAFERDFPHLA